MTSTVRTLHSAEEVKRASAAARDEYVRLFETRFGLSPAGEWLARWWPRTPLAPRMIAAVPQPLPPALLDDAAPARRGRTPR